MELSLRFCRHQELRLQQQTSGPTSYLSASTNTLQKALAICSELKMCWRANHRILQIQAAHPNRILRGRYYSIILCIIFHFWDLPPRSFHDSQIPIMMQRPETSYDDPQGSSGFTALLSYMCHTTL